MVLEWQGVELETSGLIEHSAFDVFDGPGVQPLH